MKLIASILILFSSQASYSQSVSENSLHFLELTIAHLKETKAKVSLDFGEAHICFNLGMSKVAYSQLEFNLQKFFLEQPAKNEIKEKLEQVFLDLNKAHQEIETICQNKTQVKPQALKLVELIFERVQAIGFLLEENLGIKRSKVKVK